ncbi:transglutaminase-like domain-containing protein [Vibrio sp. SCSIO 43137]|uniref:transglutaminase-like domain-containing protein n=1 Tax=Vibrio sp. SCSIO 43137 TaxID=3021011 RepID=UPI0023077CFA|nr:DUF3857 domain-containing transglutaminase family protein [Vibrio sp. SCSIO 43137]WCE31870.1 DUF3857 domain-containing transglutaminase family protein [Vibrio sp. SCSIO 43137]
MTQLLREESVDIQAEKVTIKHKRVSYFPRFIDTDNYGSQSVFFNPKTQHLRITKAASLSPSGEIKQIDPAKVQVVDTNTYNTFHSEKEVILILQGLQEGSLSVVEYEIVTQRDAMESDWSRELYLQNNYPIENYQLNVKWDKTQVFRWATDSQEVKCEEQASSLYCHGDNLDAYKGDANAYWKDHINRISIGSLDSWNQVVSRANKLMAEAEKDRKGLPQLAERLSENTDSIEQRIANILQFVSRDVRYVSMSEHGNAMTPHTLAETIENRFGDCKDKSALLKALLEVNGLQANYALVATQRMDQDKVLVPTMNVFNHVVVCFKFDGNEYCVDPTDMQTNWQYTPAWIQGKVVLPLVSGYIPHTMDSSRFRWQMQSSTEIDFTADGGQQETQKRVYLGQYASGYRSSLYPDTEKGRQDYLIKQYKRVVYDKAEPSFTIEHLEGMSAELVIHSKADLAPFLKVGEPLVYSESDAWIKDELKELRLSNEHYTEQFPGLRVESSFNYDTKGLWRITDLPASLHFSHEFGFLTREVFRESDSSINIKTVLRIPSRKVQAKDIEAFNQLLNTYSKQSEIRFKGVVMESNLPD